MVANPEQGAPLEREVRAHAAGACSVAVDCSVGKVSRVCEKKVKREREVKRV